MKPLSFSHTVLDSIASIHYGFGTLVDPIPTSFTHSWNRSAPIWRQVHETKITLISKPKQHCHETDGFFTQTPHLPLGIMTADCFPVLLAHQSGKSIGALHIGWRGVWKQFPHYFATFLKQQGHAPHNWSVLIGPGIQTCCFEVSKKLFQAFQEKFPLIPHAFKNKSISLPTLLRWSFQQEGFLKVASLPFCTQCFSQKKSFAFYSYRRDQTSHRQWSIIEITHKLKQ